MSNFKDPNRPCIDCKTVDPASFNWYYNKKRGTACRYERCRPCYNKERNKSQRNRNLQAKFGICEAQYDLILKSQNGVCAICDLPPGGENLCVDHDHKTGKIRGLIHKTCNVALGMFKDDPELLEKAATYLRKSQ